MTDEKPAEAKPAAVPPKPAEAPKPPVVAPKPPEAAKASEKAPEAKKADETPKSKSKKSKLAYSEIDDHTPRPTDLYGTVDTTGTAGDLAARPEQASPVFAQARAAALKAALDAVENHPTGRPDSVVFSGEDRSHDDVMDELRKSAKAAEEAAQVTGGPSPAQEQAAQEGTPVNPNSTEASEKEHFPA